jgi:hypothetical protein
LSPLRGEFMCGAPDPPLPLLDVPAAHPSAEVSVKATVRKRDSLKVFLGKSSYSSNQAIQILTLILTAC